MQSSAGDINQLLEILAAKDVLNKTEDPIYKDYDHLLQTIDDIQVGDVPWESFSIRYSGPITDNSSTSWQCQTYTVQ